MIIADVHEPQHLKDIADEVRELPVDYVIVGSERKYMVERKEVMDLWNSVKDGRLWRQMSYLESCRDEGYIPILYVEGSFGKLIKLADDMSVRKFIGIQLAFSSFGVSVIQLSPKLTALFLEFLDKKSGQKRKYDRPNIPKPVERTLREECVDVLRAIRGIGVKTAENLLDRFGSIHSVVIADENELKDILGNRVGHFLEVIRGGGGNV